MSRIIVIGGGVVGSATAYHLAAMGCSDVLLLERAQIGSGTTWHAAGNMETYREDPLLGEMIAYAVNLYPKLEQETGQALGWRQSGRVTFTTDPRRFEQYHDLPRVGEARGIELELLSPTDVQKKLPIINLDGLAGGLWVPSDGRVNPTDLAVALSKGARQQGASIEENATVECIEVERGKVVGVRCNGKRVTCESVVIAAGLWSAEIARTCGINLPLHAVEHFYFLTEALDCIDRDLPLFLSYDEMMYGREDVGGLLFGFLDRDAIALSPNDLPGDFSFGLLPENWRQAEPYLSTAIHRFPILESAGIRSLINGPESFTPDGNMLLGPTPGLDGLFVAAAMNSNGIALSAGAGKLTAEWILEGRPSLDATRLDVSRFSPGQGTLTFMRERVTEVPSSFGQWPELGHDYQTSRGVSRMVLHEWHVKRQAKFVSRFAWEQPEWYASSEADAATLITDEILAMDECALYDASANTKIVLEGANADKFLDGINPSEESSDVLGIRKLVVLNDSGGVEGDAVAMPVGINRWLLLAVPELSVRLTNRLKRLSRADYQDVSVTNETSAWCQLEMFGKHVSSVLTSFGYRGNCSIEKLEIGSASVSVVQQEGHLAWTLIVSADMAREVVEVLGQVARDIRPIGRLAREYWRVANAIPRWGAELTPYADWRTSQGHSAIRHLTLETSQVPEPYSPVWIAQKPVGYVTSAVKAPSGRVVLFARLEQTVTSDELQVYLSGEWRRLHATACEAQCVRSDESSGRAH